MFGMQPHAVGRKRSGIEMFLSGHRPAQNMSPKVKSSDSTKQREINVRKMVPEIHWWQLTLRGCIITNGGGNQRESRRHLTRLQHPFRNSVVCDHVESKMMIIHFRLNDIAELCDIMPRCPFFTSLLALCFSEP